jgi:hypothetical protein
MVTISPELDYLISAAFYFFIFSGFFAKILSLVAYWLVSAGKSVIKRINELVLLRANKINMDRKAI